MFAAFCVAAGGVGANARVYKRNAEQITSALDDNESKKQGMRTTTLKLKHIYKCMMIMINRLKRYRCLRFMFLSDYIAESGWQ